MHGTLNEVVALAAEAALIGEAEWEDTRRRLDLDLGLDGAGAAGPGFEVSRISVREQPLDDAAVKGSVVVPSAPSPSAFYWVEVPDWCWVDIHTDDGLQLGPIGPLPSDEHHAACMAE